MANQYSIKDWNKFQHFKERTPPWIKLYRDILDDPDWHQLDDKAAKALVMLWLIASEDKSNQGKLPCLKKISFRLRMPEKVVESILSKLCHWVDITPISGGYQDDVPETETETETEGDKSYVDQKLKDIPESIVADFLKLRSTKKAPLTETALKGIEREAGLAGISLGEALQICCERDWRGFKAEWLKERRNGHSKTDDRMRRNYESYQRVSAELEDD